MKNYKLFLEKKDEGFFYIIEQGSFLICDLDMCAKSYRTFDIKFFDLVKNKKLLNSLDIYIHDDIKDFTFIANLVIDQILRVYSPEKKRKLLTNPTIRILAEKEEIYLDLLEIFDPDHIEVSMRKYNL
jgi:hypothetical protein